MENNAHLNIEHVNKLSLKKKEIYKGNKSIFQEMFNIFKPVLWKFAKHNFYKVLNLVILANNLSFQMKLIDEQPINHEYAYKQKYPFMKSRFIIHDSHFSVEEVVTGLCEWGIMRCGGIVCALCSGGGNQSERVHSASRFSPQQLSCEKQRYQTE